VINNKQKIQKKEVKSDNLHHIDSQCITFLRVSLDKTIST